MRGSKRLDRGVMGPLNQHLGTVAKEARSKKKLTQAQVAALVDMASEVYGRMERGTMLPSICSLLRLANALDVDPNTLLGWTKGGPG